MSEREFLKRKEKSYPYRRSVLAIICGSVLPKVSASSVYTMSRGEASTLGSPPSCASTLILNRCFVGARSKLLRQILSQSFVKSFLSRINSKRITTMMRKLLQPIYLSNNALITCFRQETYMRRTTKQLKGLMKYS